MAVINFVKGEQYYTAEFQINGPVNVHIERAEAGALYFRQRSIDHGSYDLINGANWNNRGDLTIDTAIQGVVYPMWIKIESASEPTLAEMVEGEQSGGGAGTESTITYYLRPTTLDNTLSEILGVAAQIAKADVGQKIITAPLCLAEFGSSVFDYVIAFGVNPDMKLVLPNRTGTVSEIFGDTLATYTEITEEEFYNLEA